MDREKVIEMLAKVEDRFGLAVYQKVYQITDKEIANKKKEIKPHGEHK